MNPWEPIIEYFQENYPTIGGAILLVIGTVWVTKKIIVLYGRLGATEKDCIKIEDILIPKLTKLTDGINSINSNINSLVVYLKTKDVNMDSNLFVSKSPTQLTDLGEKILIDIGGKEFVDANADSLISQLDGYGIKTALDVQNSAPMVINTASKEDSFKHIKDYLFQNPSYKTKSKAGADVEIQLDLSIANTIMGIYLRNKYLDKHPELNPEDIPDNAI